MRYCVLVLVVLSCPIQSFSWWPLSWSKKVVDPYNQCVQAQLLSPYDPLINYNLGVLAHKKGDTALALASFGRVMQEEQLAGKVLYSKAATNAGHLTAKRATNVLEGLHWKEKKIAKDILSEQLGRIDAAIDYYNLVEDSFDEAQNLSGLRQQLQDFKNAVIERQKELEKQEEEKKNQQQSPSQDNKNDKSQDQNQENKDDQSNQPQNDCPCDNNAQQGSGDKNNQQQDGTQKDKPSQNSQKNKNEPPQDKPELQQPDEGKGADEGSNPQDGDDAQNQKKDQQQEKDQQSGADEPQPAEQFADDAQQSDAEQDQSQKDGQKQEQQQEGAAEPSSEQQDAHPAEQNAAEQESQVSEEADNRALGKEEALDDKAAEQQSAAAQKAMAGKQAAAGKSSQAQVVSATGDGAEEAQEQKEDDQFVVWNDEHASESQAEKMARVVLQRLEKHETSLHKQRLAYRTRHSAQSDTQGQNNW